ncbi:EG45-like domain containing protein [Phragmites australis]|uniref:EG45-like domain containing protein n=1 Tax=Phragmites australis TaxID=29695 RepID=UPI002D76FE03|nr:EG45-like domain containing protein [Phragmites australis]
MALNKMSSILMVMSVVLLGTASLATAASGVATFYTEYTPSACYGNANMSNMVAAASDSFWNNGAVCGRCYRVRCTGAAYGGSGNPCTGNSVTVKIVDECASSDGCQSTIDLSKQAFAKIASVDAGEVKVTFNPTNCP